LKHEAPKKAYQKEGTLARGKEEEEERHACGKRQQRTEEARMPESSGILRSPGWRIQFAPLKDVAVGRR